MKKKIFIGVILILTFGLVFLWVKGNDMREIKTEIEIKAQTANVWSILTDFENWNKWSPIINQATGGASLGSKLSIVMRNEDGKDGPKYMPTITTFAAPKSFRWRTTMVAEFIFTNDKVFELEETSSGTRLIHKELFSGILVPLFWGKFSQGVPPMLNSMNEGLKNRAEKNTN